MKKNLTLLVIIFLSVIQFGKAQNSYSFSRLTGVSYSDLTGATSVTAFDALGLFMLPGLQGDTFKLYGLNFGFGGLTTFAVGKAPFLRVDNDSSLIIMDGAFTYADSIDLTSGISYRISGASGNKIVTAQYKNLKLREGPAGNSINLQIVYFQKTGIIEIHYGPRSANNASGYNTINGPNIGIFYSPDSFSTCYEKLWCEGSPTSVVLDSAANFGFDAMSGVPPEGTIYRFTPRFNVSPPPPPPVTTNINDLKVRTTLLITPSPCDNELFIDGNLSGTLLLLNMQSEVLYQKTGSINERIDTSLFPSGCYWLLYSDATGMAAGKKVIIMHD